MPARGERKEQLTGNESLLSEKHARLVMQDAKAYLRQYGGIPATLLMNLNDGKQLRLPLALPQTHQEKVVYFEILGASVRRLRKEIREAVLLSESWYVEKPNIDPTLKIAPSKHPNRKEAITLVGRDHTGQKSIFALQPFGRDAQQQPLFEPLQLQQFDGKDPSAVYWVGLLDYLFPVRSNRKHH